MLIPVKPNTFIPVLKKRMIPILRKSDFVEDEHPRKGDGKFTSGAGEGKKAESKEAQKPGKLVEVNPNEKSAPAKTKFKNAKTIQEAEQYLRDTHGIQNVDYGKLDIEIANECNRVLGEYFKNYPQLKKRHDMIGSTQARFRQQFEEEKKNALAGASEILRNMGYSEDQINKYAYSFARAHAKKTPRNSYAYADFDDNRKRKGIFISEKFNRTELEIRLNHDVNTNFHPVGCNTTKFIVDHEMAHCIDKYYNISSLPEVTKLYSTLRKAKKISDQLSVYAGKNIKEFVAEAWAEYKNNPDPRPVAKAVGTLIAEKINNH